MIYLLISLIVLVWFCCILSMLILFKLYNVECNLHWIYQQIEELKTNFPEMNKEERDGCAYTEQEGRDK